MYDGPPDAILRSREAFRVVLNRVPNGRWSSPVVGPALFHGKSVY